MNSINLTPKFLLMKAAVHKKYGGPEVVQIIEVAKPRPTTGHVLIKVVASTVNRTDSGFRSAEYVISRFWSGIFRPKQQILGSEFAGIIEEIGPDVKNFRVGDKVFGFNDKTFGGHAEFITVPANSGLAKMPQGIDFETAAALTEGSHYALNTIRAAKVLPGQHALVYGATGAIGSAAVQLLKHYGAEVTAVCNTKNVGLIKSIGADVIIDYENEDFTKIKTRFDFVFDAVGKSSFKECKPLMYKTGVYISTELGKNAENVWYALFTPWLGGKKVLFPIPIMSQADAEFLAELYEKGAFKPVIDRYYQLDDIVEAYKYVESGTKTGNVVLKIAD